MSYADSKDRNARYDALQVKLLSTGLKEGDTAIDIGAHAGQYCILMTAMCGQTGQVVAFEPDPYARAILSKNLDLNPNIKKPIVESYALSDAPGEAVLYSRGGNSQSSLARSGVGLDATNEIENIRVALTTLDAYLFEKNLPTPSWVKIDTEGAEIRILKGAEMLLSSKANIVCELHPYAWAEFGSTFAELKTLVSAAGRRMRYLDETSEIGDEPIYGSVLLEQRSRVTSM